MRRVVKMFVATMALTVMMASCSKKVGCPNNLGKTQPEIKKEKNA